MVALLSLLTLAFILGLLALIFTAHEIVRAVVALSKLMAHPYHVDALVARIKG